MYLSVIAGQPLSARRAVRQLVALTQGILNSVAPGSGIANGSEVDRFSAADIAAMQIVWLPFPAHPGHGLAATVLRRRKNFRTAADRPGGECLPYRLYRALTSVGRPRSRGGGLLLHRQGSVAVSVLQTADCNSEVTKGCPAWPPSERWVPGRWAWRWTRPPAPYLSPTLSQGPCPF